MNCGYFKCINKYLQKKTFLTVAAAAAATTTTAAIAAAAYLFKFEISVHFSSTIWDKQIYGNKFLLKSFFYYQEKKNCNEIHQLYDFVQIIVYGEFNLAVDASANFFSFTSVWDFLDWKCK